jgi:hypothetical protein
VRKLPPVTYAVTFTCIHAAIALFVLISALFAGFSLLMPVSFGINAGLAAWNYRGYKRTLTRRSAIREENFETWMWDRYISPLEPVPNIVIFDQAVELLLSSDEVRRWSYDEIVDAMRFFAPDGSTDIDTAHKYYLRARLASIREERERRQRYLDRRKSLPSYDVWR